MAMATLSPSTIRANGSGSVDADAAPERPRSLQPAVGGGMTGRSDAAPGRDGRNGRAGPSARGGKGNEPVGVGGADGGADAARSKPSSDEARFDPPEGAAGRVVPRFDASEVAP